MEVWDPGNPGAFHQTDLSLSVKNKYRKLITYFNMNINKHSGCRTLPFLIIMLLVASCSTPLREVTYMYGIDTGQLYEHAPIPDDYRIRANDLLYIRIIGVDPANVAFLNLIGAQTTAVGGGNLELITYLVDEAGDITYPFLGKINVENKTLTEIQAILQEQVDNYLQNSSVFVKLVGRTIVVLGEVGSPGQHMMTKSRISIFETIAVAGDVSDYGNKKNVKLIRELPEGKLVVELDLTDPALIHSPYYYILPHDIIYVENRTRIFGAKGMAFTAPITITASVISLGLLIVNILR
jgi:polysaccharide biosynthesis/export protein